MENRTTPDMITELKENQVFVFGSNLSGNHAGGAAKIAKEKFGAIDGQPLGLHGDSYAIPTVGENFSRTLTIQEISDYVAMFFLEAMFYKDLQFLVTPIGCGIAGHKAEDIAPLFEGAKEIQNIHLPESFWKILRQC